MGECLADKSKHVDRAEATVINVHLRAALRRQFLVDQ